MRDLLFTSAVCIANIAACIVSVPARAQLQVTPATTRATVSWATVLRKSVTTPTLQVVVNPLLRPSSPISHRAFAALSHLGANYVRFVPWLPYPRLAVAELKPPANGKTYWNFSLIDPMVKAFMKATKGRPVIMNFSTVPEWMFTTPSPVAYPKDPNQVTWNYEQGTELTDTSLNTIADYYARLVSWYTRGGFKDEYGHWHHSGYHYHFAWWEVLNEVDAEHHMNVQEYSRWYDAITAAIHKVSPNTKFVGIALAGTSNWNPDDLGWFSYFIKHRHHARGIPINMISYHFYASPPANSPAAKWPGIVFKQADGFLEHVQEIQNVRRQFNPSVQTDIDEIGTMMPNDNGAAEVKSLLGPSSYWNLSGAMFAYLFGNLAAQGIQIAGESQLIGYPSQFPSVSMVNWQTGVPNARFRVLELLHDNFRPGDEIVRSTTSNPNVYVQGFVTPNGARKVLLVNKRNRPVAISLSHAAGGTEEWVDEVTASSRPSYHTLKSDVVQLGGLAVSVVTLARG